MGRRVQKLDKGDAISMEDALSMLVVIFVLFVVFLVPLVSMDKPPQLQTVPEDPFWASVSRSLEQQSPQAQQYSASFGVLEPLASRASSLESTQIIEILSPDSSVSVIQHDLSNQEFVSIYAPTGGQSLIYKTGQLQYDSIEKEWVIKSSSTLYYPNANTEPMEYRYKQWFRSFAQ